MREVFGEMEKAVRRKREEVEREVRQRREREREVTAQREKERAKCAAEMGIYAMELAFLEGKNDLFRLRRTFGLLSEIKRALDHLSSPSFTLSSLPLSPPLSLSFAQDTMDAFARQLHSVEFIFSSPSSSPSPSLTPSISINEEKEEEGDKLYLHFPPSPSSISSSSFSSSSPTSSSLLHCDESHLRSANYSSSSNEIANEKRKREEEKDQRTKKREERERKRKKDPIMMDCMKFTQKFFMNSNGSRRKRRKTVHEGEGVRNGSEGEKGREKGGEAERGKERDSSVKSKEGDEEEEETHKPILKNSERRPGKDDAVETEMREILSQREEMGKEGRVLKGGNGHKSAFVREMGWSPRESRRREESDGGEGGSVRVKGAVRRDRETVRVEDEIQRVLARVNGVASAATSKAVIVRKGTELASIDDVMEDGNGQEGECERR